VNDVTVATCHQDIGDGLAERFALRNSGEMLLALAGGGGDKIGNLRAFGILENRPRHVDVVVESEHPHDAVRSGRQLGEADRKLDARLGLDRRCQFGDHLVEQADLIHGIAVGAGHEEVRDARQYLVALGIAAACQRTLELIDQRRLGCHGLWRISPWAVQPQHGFPSGRARLVVGRACRRTAGLPGVSARSFGRQNGRQS
jgi:hypothetical protein